MNKYEEFACGQIFCSYPEALSFQEIIDLCNDDEKRDSFNEKLEDTDDNDQQLDLCEKHEYEWWENIPTLLTELAESAKYHFESKEGN